MQAFLVVLHTTSCFDITGGVDYGSGLYNVTIPAKMIGTSFSVPIIDDNILENDERFSLRIVSNSLPEYVIVNHPSLTTVSIRDDDGEPVYYTQFCICNWACKNRA